MEKQIAELQAENEALKQQIISNASPKMPLRHKIVYGVLGVLAIAGVAFGASKLIKKDNVEEVQS